MRDPYFTIGIMTYNYGQFIEKAVKSVFAQTINNWELFIVDDASSDNTEEIVRPFLSDKRVNYICHGKNLGQAATWKQVLNLGRGEVVCTLHADDFWESEILESAYDAFASNKKLDVYSFNWKIIGEEKYGPVKNREGEGKKIFIQELDKNTMLPSATFLRRNLINKCGSPNSEYGYAVDADYFHRILLKCREFKSNSQPLLNYRVHNLSTTAKFNNVNKIKEGLKISLSLKKEQKNKLLKSKLSKKISRMYLLCAIEYLKIDDLSNALKDIKKSFFFKPSNSLQERFYSVLLLLNNS